MTIQIAHGVGPSKIDVAYEVMGSPEAPPVVLIMGLGAQLIAWPDRLCQQLMERGMNIIRFDNRDAGASTHVASLPDFPAVLAGDFTSVPYTLSDMAADTVGLLDALGIDSAHIVGASMGACIAQTIAIEHPARVRSLTSIMASTGAKDVGQQHPDTRQLFAGGPPRTREAAIQKSLDAVKLIGSPGFEHDLVAIADRRGREWDRDQDVTTMLRQGAAVIASGDRTAKLRTLRVPALVIHGDRDKVWDVSGGRATAAAIPGAELLVIEGMGHDMPRGTWPQLVDRIAAIVERGERR